MKITEQILTAYVDGELEGSDKKTVEEQTAKDNQIRTQVESLKSIDRLINAAFPIHEDVPEQLIEAVTQGSINENNNTAKNNVIPLFGRHKKPGLSKAVTAIPYAVAASITLVVGIMFGYLANTPNDRNVLDSVLVSEINTHSRLYEVLENSPSSTPSKITSENNQEFIIEPLLSFKSVNGDYCREFDIHNNDKKTLAGIACREQDATWRLEIMVASDTQPNNYDIYQLSSGQDEEALDQVADNLMSNDPLSKTEEEILINNNWK